MQRAHRVVTMLLPLPVALAMVWAGPIVAEVLPAYAPGIGALRLLAVAALLFSVATLPGYFLLASGFHRRLLVLGGLATALDLVLVFTVAARDPRPASVAAAALGGYAAFALALVGAAAPVLFGRTVERVRFVATSFAPAIVTGAATLAVCTWHLGRESWRFALLRTGVILPVVLLVLALFAWSFGFRPGARAPAVTGV